jgi:2-aminoadipate transaminase
VDADGMRTDHLAERLAALVREGRRPKLIYTIPTFQNPTGTTLALSRRRELLDLAQQYDVAVLEDDAYGEMRLDGEPVPSLFELDGGVRVVRTGTLSKTLGAGVRVGWLVAPPALLDYIAGFNFAGAVSPLTSRVCAAYMRQHFEPHLAELREIYRVKRDTLLHGLDEGLRGTGASWLRPDGGFFIWLQLPPRTDGRRLAELAREQGIGYMPGPYFMLDGGGEDHIRLAYSSMTVEQLRTGTRALCQAILAAGS